MFFLNPTYLWAFLGLVIPIAVHLWSKKDGEIIKIGSTKLLIASDSRQTSSIQLHEFLLLLVRIILITVLVLLIAEPRIKKKASTIPITYIIEPSLLNQERIKPLLDTIETGGSLRLLQDGFPEIQRNTSDYKNIKVPNYWKLANDMEKLATDSIVVFTNAFLSGIKGKRPDSIHKNISWIPVRPDEFIKEKILKVTKEEDTLRLLTVTSNYLRLFLEKKTISLDTNQFQFNTARDSITFMFQGVQKKIPFTIQKPLRVLLFYDNARSNEKAYLVASCTAISTYIDRQIDVKAVQRVDALDLSSFDLVLWLHSDPIPTLATKLLVYKPDDFADQIIEAGISNTIFYLTKPLTLENSVDTDLPEHLLKLFDIHKDIRDDIDIYDKRSMDIAALRPAEASLVKNKKRTVIVDISRWLCMLLILLMITERGIAKYRKQ
ncbi:BatA domain-containing protein [Aquimarina sp. RZ0]|uniref:BatA domain-containing protein n=1 Tax=Aquimarina sp. RZ0 TaxID=2607730 RepID=UPI0011F2CB6E|nr:BatA domain-containing protein [Aquimarina sp. RZ0]KAA1243251.1 hypothetical protein F0000_21850 [Aquimarina sp. RZ0]